MSAIEPVKPFYLHVDTETTGLLDRDQVWEIAWILEDSDGAELQRRRALVRHSRAPSPWVLGNTLYAERWKHADLAFPRRLSEEIAIIDAAARRHGADPPTEVYLVGANPAFDVLRLRRAGDPRASNCGLPWHFRLIDIEVLIMGAFGLGVPPSLDELSDLTGISNRTPHDAMSDAQHVRDFWAWYRAKVAADRNACA